MILETAVLDVIPHQQKEFEAAFKIAQNIISSMPGYLEHQLQKCIEKENRYLLLVKWQRLADHAIGFRQSAEYQDWKALLHHFYQRFPEVEHYRLITTNRGTTVNV